MTKLEQAKQVIKERFDDAQYGIFSSRNIAGDHMTNIYDDGELEIDICYGWMYFEVFGLSEEEFEELSKYYEQLKEGNTNV